MIPWRRIKSSKLAVQSSSDPEMKMLPDVPANHFHECWYELIIYIYLTRETLWYCWCCKLCTLTGNPYDSRAAEPARAGPTARPQPISVPSLSIEEIRECTDNFGPKALIGEGSYGRVYYATLQDRVAAIKKLDASAQPETEFLSQVWLLTLM